MDSNTGAKFLRTPILKNICERLLLDFVLIHFLLALAITAVIGTILQQILQKTGSRDTKGVQNGLMSSLKFSPSMVYIVGHGPSVSANK